MAAPPPAPCRSLGLPLRLATLLLVLALGLLLLVWQLGATGLVDETPPLFAASARAMAETGDWLIPRVNGLPRYDKPPLVYWFMGLFYALPHQPHWNPLGTWAARLPSALASVTVMLALAATVLDRPQPTGTSTRTTATTAVTAALAFGLSPLVLLWGRIAVSDALFSALVAVTLLLSWQAYADPRRSVGPVWLVLALAVLAKGPVAVLLCGLCWLLFGLLQGDLPDLWRRLRPWPGLLVTAAVALPWYGAALLVEGRPFLDSFFGYHNLQRFTAVVNDHLQPWWFFGPVLVIASLPATPLLLLGLGQALGGGRRAPAASLGRFAGCWLLAILLFFTVAATKLPSYWLPATPAAGLLIALAAAGRPRRWAWGLTLLLALLIALAFGIGPRWLPLIQDPELPGLGAAIIASGRMPLAAGCWLAAALLPLLAGRLGASGSIRLLAVQLPLVLFVPLALLPLWALGDGLRGAPVRSMAAAVRQQRQVGESLAMVGILKPSLHYYARQVVIYEGRSEHALVNLAERLAQERRRGLEPQPAQRQATVLVVIDQGTAVEPWWQGLAPQELDRAGLYRLWRVDRRRLEGRAAELRAAGHGATWTVPRPERY
ncbi:MAG: glycosyltransferase family 39 protein [Cyanobacteriota bacterium]|nr:glycosyltransferase family 39 protein [Cyanobacteriota bacterium]